MGKIMTGAEAIRYIEARGHQPAASARPDDNPEKTRALLNAMDADLGNLRFIHVCGSNGKGSVCAMLDAILRAAGYRVGLFTSPHVQDFRERIRVDGALISEEALGAAGERLRDAAESAGISAGYFCLATALALDCFAASGCDFVILEAGIGGRHDATNAIDHKDLAVVTAIGLEHTDVLGDSPEDIAGDKAGILTPGCACVACDNGPAVNAVIRDVCEEQHIPLTIADASEAAVVSASLAPCEQVISYRGQTYTLPLLGRFQADNMVLALTAVEALRSRGIPVPEEAVGQGLASVRWPARCEVLSTDPVILLDGGHNPPCAEALKATLDALFGDAPVLFLTGMMRDKRISETLRILLPRADHFYCVSPDQARGLPASDLARMIEALGRPAAAYSSLTEAFADARDAAARARQPLVIFGSFYLAGAVRDLLKRVP